MEAHEFIVGKWYKTHDGRYGKFSRFTRGHKGEPDYYFHWSEWLDKNLNHEFYNGNWYRTDIEKEADMSIIACQLPYSVEPNYQIF